MHIMFDFDTISITDYKFVKEALLKIDLWNNTSMIAYATDTAKADLISKDIPADDVVYIKYLNKRSHTVRREDIFAAIQLDIKATDGYEILLVTRDKELERTIRSLVPSMCKFITMDWDLEFQSSSLVSTNW